MGRAFLLSSVVGGFFLWFYAVSIGDELAVTALVFWFISLPIAIGISLLANAVPSGFATLARNYRYANVFTVTGIAALLPPLLCATSSYEGVPTYLGRVGAYWWIGAWAACMVSIFWLVTSVGRDVESGPDQDAI